MRAGSTCGWVACAAMCGPGCGGRDEPLAAETAPTTGAPFTTTAATTTTGHGSGTGSSPGSTSTASGTTTTTGAATTTGMETGGPSCAKNVVLTGYWPPTNEMLRPWSTNPAQNEGGWVGANWGGHGYDVYAFFPEFPPDGDPTNDAIGEEGSVGSPRSELRVVIQVTTTPDVVRVAARELSVRRPPSSPNEPSGQA